MQQVSRNTRGGDAGLEALVLRTPVETHGENLRTMAEFTIGKGERVHLS